MAKKGMSIQPVRFYNDLELSNLFHHRYRAAIFEFALTMISEQQSLVPSWYAWYQWP